MQFIYNYLFLAMWLVYLGYWRAISKNVKQNVRLEAFASRFTRMLMIVCAAALLLVPRVPFAFLNRRFLPAGPLSFWTGAAITASGLLFSVWARLHIGKNWSSDVTVKVDHELITTGPYALVRHPIYTGLLIGFLGSAVARGELRGILAFALVVIALWIKLRLEETWMREHFGAAYAGYSAQRVKALVPYIL